MSRDNFIIWVYGLECTHDEAVPTISPTSMHDFHDQHQQHIVMDFINDPVIAYPNAVTIFKALKFDNSPGTRIVNQSINFGTNLVMKSLFSLEI